MAILGGKGMKYMYMFIMITWGFFAPAMAQETDLKKIYTDITTTINSALLTRKGAFELSGNIFYDRLETEYRLNNDKQEFTNETFQFDAGLAHFLVNNLSLGVLISYLNQKQYTERIEHTMVGPVIKYYIGEKRWRPYLFADYLFMTGDVMDGGETDIGAGLLYHVTGNFAISLQFKYGILSADEETFKGLNRIFIGLGIVNFIL